MYCGIVCRDLVGTESVTVLSYQGSACIVVLFVLMRF